MRACILNFRYWMDEPGDDVMWFYSENHALMFHTLSAAGRGAVSVGDLFQQRHDGPYRCSRKRRACCWNGSGDF